MREKKNKSDDEIYAKHSSREQSKKSFTNKEFVQSVAMIKRRDSLNSLGSEAKQAGKKTTTTVLETLKKLDLNVKQSGGVSGTFDDQSMQSCNFSKVLDNKEGNRKIVQGYNTYDHGSSSWVRTPTRLKMHQLTSNPQNKNNFNKIINMKFNPKNKPEERYE